MEGKYEDVIHLYEVNKASKSCVSHCNQDLYIKLQTTDVFLCNL